MMRAKMKVTAVQHHSDTYEALSFSAVSKCDGYPEDGSDENNTFAKFSPSICVDMFIANPALVGAFEVGETFYIDFIPAPK